MAEKKPVQTIFEIRVPKDNEETPEAAEAFFKALPSVKNSLWAKLTRNQTALSFEMATVNQRIYFLAAVPAHFASYFVSQLTAQYPQALINPVGDYLPYFFPENLDEKEKMETSAFGQLCFDKPAYLPLKTYLDFRDIDPLSTVLGTLSKLQPQTRALIQVLVSAASSKWQDEGTRLASTLYPTSDPDRKIPHPQKNLIEQKIKQTGFTTGIKLLVFGQKPIENQQVLENIAGSFGTIASGEGNKLVLATPTFWQKSGFFKSIFQRNPAFVPSSQVLTASELATVYHLPNKQLSKIKNIAWGGTVKGEPPENLPVSTDLTEEEKKEINFFAKTEFKSQETVFGIKNNDRRKHLYIIGKTGTGKTTLIANMAINDIRAGAGVGIIDPHGDLSEILLNYIPSNRINDVAYLDPADNKYPFRLNPLEVKNKEQAELVASGIVSIFHKLYAYSWGPRLEYILRNTILTLVQKPQSTLADVPKILSDDRFRQKTVDKLKDEVLKNFWLNEYNKMGAKLRAEAISPILNKVGQFVTSPKMRKILSYPTSTVSLEEIMNDGKIMILNASQGKIGEDNAALLGAMFITKMQLAAMNRVFMPEEKRRDFYLYVDEFQNFATDSFIKILSEARKYRLNLAVANQYIGQVPEDVQKAIFGNVGTLASFIVGAEDARKLAFEFGGVYEEKDLVALGRYQVVLKLSIDNLVSTPFAGKTLPLPACTNRNRPKIIRVSRERYTKK